MKGWNDMTTMQRLRARRLLRDTHGLTTVEYVIVLAMIAVMSVGLWKEFGEKLHGYLTKSKTTIDTNMPTEVK